MRNELRKSVGLPFGLGFHPSKMPQHLDLAYGSWAPTEEELKADRNDNQIGTWLSDVSDIQVSNDYRHAFELWKSNFVSPGDRLAVLTLAGRLLVGHGNASPTEVGLTVHHTWGVPVIPGSALKGLLAHYIDATYGPDNASLPPWDLQGEECEQARFRGLTWNERRITGGPGEVYRALFGAPDAEEDRAMIERGFAAGASRGWITFHDALYIVGSAPHDRPFAIDVLTVHQKRYYDRAGTLWASDHDNPNAVAFLTVRPRVKFLLALSGLPDWTGTDLAALLLKDALGTWGVGGKTSGGYGLGSVGKWTIPEPPASAELKEFLAWLEGQHPDGQAFTWRHLLTDIKKRRATLERLSPADLRRAEDAIKRKVKSRHVIAERDAFLNEVRQPTRND